MMGGAMVQLAFNLGNAVGAYFGGLSIEHGAGLESTALIGSFFALLGTAVFLVFNYMVFKPQRIKTAFLDIETAVRNRDGCLDL